MPVEDTPLWTSQTFVRSNPQPGELEFTADPIVAISQTVVNTGDRNSALLTVKIDAIEPDAEVTANGYGLFVNIEGQAAPGIWVPIATMDRPINGTNDPLLNYVELTPEFNLNEGNALIFESGEGQVARSNHNGVATGEVRAKVLYKVFDPTKPLLESVTLSAYMRLFDR